tara:strand:+ start:385 stop:765 length:381 start_codon:yes stop_codon:yes gene_type:complete
MDIIEIALIIFALPLGWLFVMIGNQQKNTNRTHAAIWKRVYELEATFRSHAAIWKRIYELEATLQKVQSSTDSIELVLITKNDVRAIVDEEFEPLQLEHNEVKDALKLLSQSIVSLEKQLITLSVN